MERQKEAVIKLDLESLCLLDLCASIEVQFAELYRFFAKLFIEDPNMSALWNKTANEEENHAEQFKLAVRLKGTGIVAVKVEHSKIKLIIETLNTILPKFKESNPTPTQALMFAIQLEEKLFDYHTSTLLDFADNGLAKLFKAMANNDIEHINMLKKALKKISVV